jgi:hypothetical protein
VTQRTVETVIGRLATDEDFRAEFLIAPEHMLTSLGDMGMALTAVEVAAFVATDRRLWEFVADVLDPRLQEASLKP